MKILLINGSPHEKGCTYTALQQVAKPLHQHRIATEMLFLGNAPVPGCTACGTCRQTGACVLGGPVNHVLEQLDHYQGIVVGSPVYYGGASGQITSFLDRLFYSGSHRMATKLGASVVSCRRGGATATFDQLNKYFAMSNMPIVPSSYWNQVHGNTPEEVLQDKEGLHTMRTLGENMAWLLGCIQAGKDAGVPGPHYEPKISTNFIR